MPISESQVTLQDIAREAELSVSAVSMALSGYPDISPATRMRVMEIGRRLNYRPRRRRTIGRRGVPIASIRRFAMVMVGYDYEPTYLAPLLRCIRNEGQHHNFKIEVAAIESKAPAQQAQHLERIAMDVDGLLLDGFVCQEVFDRSATLAIPSILMGNVEGDPLRQQLHGYRVGVDTRAMGQLATRTLLEAGHRRVAFLSTRFIRNFWFEQWYQGYRHAHVEAGLPVDETLVKVMTGDVNHGELAIRELLAAGPMPTGYVVPNPLVAQQALAALSNAGQPLDPANIVIGATVEGARERNVEHLPRLSSDPDRLAKASLELLLRAMDGQQPSPCKLLVPFDTYNFPGQLKPESPSS